MPSTDHKTTSTFSRIVLLFVGLAWLWFFGVIIYSSGNSDFKLFTSLALGGVCLAIIWIVLSSLKWAILWQNARKQWFSVPVAGVLGLVLCMNSHWMVKARVMISENRMRDYVAGVAPGTVDRRMQWIGLMLVEETEEYEGGVYLYTGHEFINRVGVAYLPPDTKPAGRIRVEHLYGNWYSFVWHF